jgi:hypothetical protein
VAENDVGIYMDGYRKAQTVNLASHRRYADELLCANWNPAIGMFASPQLPEDLSRIDANAFLNRVYALATRV